jgi:PilZ domain
MDDQSGKNVTERRRHRRFPCEGFAEVTAFRSNVLFRGRIRDISESGCFVETRATLNLPRLAEVEVRFTAGGIKQAVLGRVMVVLAGKGAGFEFVAADPRLGKNFHSLIEQLEAKESITTTA